jgi:zinc transporter ZupT
MKKERFFEVLRIPLLGLVSASCGILVVAQSPASAANTPSWGVQRIMKDVTSVIAAGVGASVSAMTYLPASVSVGPTVGSGVAGSAGFTAGGGTKVAGDYLVTHPRTSIRTLVGTVMTGDITSIAGNIKAATKSFTNWFSR